MEIYPDITQYHTIFTLPQHHEKKVNRTRTLREFRSYIKLIKVLHLATDNLNYDLDVKMDLPHPLPS